MSNQVFSNGLQLGSPSPATSYESIPQVFQGILSINGPAGGQVHNYKIIAEGKLKTLIIEKFTTPATQAAASWDSYELFPSQFSPSYKQAFVVPIMLNNASFPGYFIWLTTGFFSIVTPLTPTIGQNAGWEDITITYI